MEKQTIKDIVFEEIDKVTNNSFYLKGYVDSKKLKEKFSKRADKRAETSRFTDHVYCRVT